MALAKTQIIDAVGICKQTGKVVLSLMDEEDWDEDQVHLELLEKKLATYLRFIESGDIRKAYPKSQGREIRIEIHGRDQPPGDGVQFLDQLAERVRQKGIEMLINYHGN
ncbi:DUF6572 domain-containing protein [Bremerella sp. T1]|uniref:DUF6572 domain-containing protein n=1 Tax=Bremerella sp. TYQ1 TaxID=3119568 RepID=UPI001CCCCEE9|nr:DUF6572 domain-containing protein [Bremerella volcania]UBM35563.1 hypothetical protein LA756_23155 [Bremerella volcania]